MLGRGVAGDEAMTSSRETGFASGEFTGRNAAAMATEVGGVIDGDARYRRRCDGCCVVSRDHQSEEGEKRGL